MALGPIWIVLGPVLFVGFLGALFVGYSNSSADVFIPHMTIGYIVWTLLGGYLSRGHSIFSRKRSYLLLERARYTDIVLLDNSELIIHFLHQCIIIFLVCWYYKTVESLYVLMAIPGLCLILLNGYWISFLFGLIGARFKDFGEIITSVVRVAFFATPIIWYPGESVGQKKQIFQLYLDFNPFYHFLQLVRAPLVGDEISLLTWMVVGCFSLFGFLITGIAYRYMRHLIVFWV